MAPLGTQSANWSQTLMKSKQTQFFPVVSFFWVKLRWKPPLLVRCEILGLFVTKLTANGKYSCFKRENFPQAIQMKLSKKTKIFD